MDVEGEGRQRLFELNQKFHFAINLIFLQFPEMYQPEKIQYVI